MPRPALRQVFLSSRVASKPVLTIECWLVWAGHSRCKNKKLCGWCQHYRLHITSITSCSCNDGKSINNSMRGKSTCFRRILKEAARCTQWSLTLLFCNNVQDWGSLSGRRKQLVKHLALVLLDMCRYFFLLFFYLFLTLYNDCDPWWCLYLEYILKRMLKSKKYSSTRQLWFWW